MSTIKSVTSLATVLKKPKISRKHLSRYSWLPDVLRIEGSIAVRIIGPVLTVTLFASGVAYAWYRGHDVTLSNTVTPLLAVVVGLILVFRNGTSYDRFYEGRKDFGQMVSNIRNLSRQIWVTVAIPPDSDAATLGKGPAGGQMNASQLRSAKADTLKLAVAFAYAVKHRLRGENGTDYEDYEGILPPFIARYEEAGSTNASSPISRNTSYHATGSISPPIFRRKSEDETANDNSGGIASASSKIDRHKSNGRGIHVHDASVTLSEQGPNTPLLGDSHRTVQFHPYSSISTIPLPLIIAHELSRMIFKFRKDGYLETIGPAGTNAMNALIQGMVDQLTNMERVANTPIPISYGIHLKQCVTLYVFALPFTLVRDLHWKMIPIVTVVAFTLMGIEGIANEIEMPFGHEKTDLPLDKFCAELKDEVDFIIRRLPEGGEGMHGYDDGEGDD
ncbi:UPF0187-domain-containing protein [Phellopilus nigrolimitatus]|nr:UPF0187-domain-containing protein [Phellopilus nigrolimitatus]